MRNLEHYYHESLRKDYSGDFASLPLSDIARDGNAEGITELVELVVAAAVSCENRAEYVERIMTKLSADSQVEMKGIIERGMVKLTDYVDSDEEEGDENELVFGDDGDEDAYGEGEYGAGKDMNESGDDDAMNRKLFSGGAVVDSELEQQLADARRELASLRSQAAIADEDHERAQQKLRALVEDLQDRLSKRQDHLSRVEEDLSSATRELEETKFKLQETVDEKKQLADDLEIQSAKALQLHKAEATLVAYKKKLENVGGMNQQMTDLEDQAANYLRQIMELEAEVKKSKSLSKENAELQEKVSRLEKDRKQMESSTMSSAVDIDELRSQLSAAEKSKKMFEEELRELRAQQETMAAMASDAPPSPKPAVSPAEAAISKEQREKLMRLEIENQKLQEELGKVKSQEEARSTALAASAASDSSEMTELKSEIQRLQEDLAAKEKENAKISSDKDKLEAYTKRTLAKFQDKYLVALQECKAKLKEKQDKIEALETRSVSERNAQKREERLLSSTIYELGMAIMQAKLKER